MAEQFDIAARRHLDTAEALERAGHLDDAGYHYGIAGETAVKQSIFLVSGPLPAAFKKHFHDGLRDRIVVGTDRDVAAVLNSGRLGGGLANDLQGGKFSSRFVNWHINIRYADTRYPVTTVLLAGWKADAIALMNGGVF
jgi:hypothetical protein